MSDDDLMTAPYPAPFPYGPPVLPRLYLHPDAAGGWLPSGDPIDAGTMHHLAHNLSLMCRESHRHLVADVGPGKMPRNGSAYTGNGWDGGYSDGVNSASTDVDFAGTAVAWDRRTARSYHLANLIADRKLPGGGYGLRVIEVEIDCYLATANTLQLFAALTASYNTPDQGSLATSTWSDWSSATFTGNTDGLNPADTLPSGRQTVRLWLITKTPAGASWAQWKARDSATVAAAASMVYEGHLWVGWRSSNSDNAIISINAWEVPTPFSPLVDPWYNGTASGEALWWIRSDTNDTSVQNNGGDAVSTLVNLASGYAGLASMSAYTLEIVRNAVGGYPAIRIPPTVSKWMDSATMPLVLDEFTVFAVIIVREANTTGSLAVFSTYGVVPSADGGGGLIASGGSWGAWSENRSTGFVGTTLALNKPYILCGRADEKDVFVDVNGIQVGTVARPAASGSTAQKEQIGRDGSFHAGDGSFDLCEVISYNKHLSVEERAFVLEYLNRRYGVF